MSFLLGKTEEWTSPAPAPDRALQRFGVFFRNTLHPTGGGECKVRRDLAIRVDGKRSARLGAGPALGRVAFGEPRRWRVFVALAFAVVFVAAVMPRGARAAIGFLQQAAGGGSNVSSYTITLTSTPATGDALVLSHSGDIQGASDISSVTGGGVTWAFASKAGAAQNRDHEIWYGCNASGSGTTTITVTLGANLGVGNGASGNVSEWSGIAASSCLDQTASNSGNSTSPTTGMTPATSQANELLIGGMHSDDAAASAPSNGFSALTFVGTAVGGTYSGYRVVSSIGTYSTGWTTTANRWAANIATFRAAGGTGGLQVSSRSDTLSDSRPSATSNHTLVFTVNNAIYGSSVSNSSTVVLTFDASFSFPSNLDCGDVDAATSVQFSFNYPGCAATATAWGFSATGSVITLVPPSGTGVYVPTSTQVTIKIGSNATVQQQGAHWITNPPSAGTYTISVGGTFGGSGNMLVSILSGVTVEARVAEHLTVAIRGVPNWYNASWGYRERITVDRNKVSGSATSFPVLVNTTDPDWRHTANGGHVGSVTGWDFVFTDRDGLTKLDHEIEKYASTTGEFVSWVRAPFLSSTLDTVVYLYYGNAGASDQQNVTGVWDTNYKGVWHMTTTSTNTTLTFDSTVNSNTGTKLSVSEPTSTSTGQIDGAQSFDGVNDYVRDGTMNSFSSNLTTGSFSAWIKTSSTAIQVLAGTLNEPTSEAFYRIIINFNPTTGANETGKLQLYIRSNSTNDLGGGVNSNTGIVDDKWHHIVMTHDKSAGTINIYVDGVVQDIVYFQQQTGTSWIAWNFPILLGALNSGGTPQNFFNGSMDELRISNVVRSSARIQTEYNNQSSPNTFYDLGAEEAQAQIACSADDGATVSVVNTSETNVDFGNISANTFFQGCQDIEISTNAGGGYVMTAQEDGPMRTGSGATIADTSCDSGCDQITAGTWTSAANVGFGHTCRNQTNNDCNAEYANGTKFRRFPSLSTGGNLAVKVATGSYTGNGAARTISHGLGVQPKVVMVWRDEDASVGGLVLRTDQHTSTSSIRFPTGSELTVFSGNMIEALGSTTFSLGTSTSVNQSSISYQWIAYAGNGVATGGYDGDGVDDRNIPHGLGAAPKMLFVWRDAGGGNSGITGRTDQYSGVISYMWRTFLSNSQRVSDQIKAMDGQNFQVGFSSAVNLFGSRYKWFALGGPSVQTGSYTGDGNDNRDISHSLSATPSATFVWRDQDSVTDGLVARSDRYSGDVSAAFDTGTNNTSRIADMVQTMTVTSFQAGTNSRVNSNTVPYQWFAVKTSSAKSEKLGETIMASSTPVSIAVGRVKYRLSVPSSQAAGTYTTKIIYIITPTY